MSSADGSSCAAFFCATSRICLSSFITASSARTDFSRPTNSGTIMCGKHDDIAQRQHGAAGRHSRRGRAAFRPGGPSAVPAQADRIQSWLTSFMDSRRAVRPTDRHGPRRTGWSPDGPMRMATPVDRRHIGCRANAAQGLEIAGSQIRDADAADRRRSGAAFRPFLAVRYSGLARDFGDFAVDHHLLHPIQPGQGRTWCPARSPP